MCGNSCTVCLLPTKQWVNQSFSGGTLPNKQQHRPSFLLFPPPVAVYCFSKNKCEWTGFHHLYSAWMCLCVCVYVCTCAHVHVTRLLSDLMTEILFSYHGEFLSWYFVLKLVLSHLGFCYMHLKHNVLLVLLVMSY